MIKKAHINSPEVPQLLRAAGHVVIENGLNLLQGKAWIAGGALRAVIDGQEKTDLDCYFRYKTDWGKTKDFLIKKFFWEKEVRYSYTDETVLGLDLDGLGLKYKKIDLITRYFGKSPIDCLEGFDFTCCALAIDKEHNLYWHEDALDHIFEKKLVVLNPINIFGTLWRLNKYGQKGYSIDLDELKKIFEIVGEGDVEMERLLTRGQSY